MTDAVRSKVAAILATVAFMQGPCLYADEGDGELHNPASHESSRTHESAHDHEHAHVPPGRPSTEPGHAHTVEGYERIEEIIVTGDPLGDVDSHMMMPVQVLGRDELESRSIRNIGEVVANELGVTTGDFGTAVGRPVIRGLAGHRVGVLENGTSTMDVSNIGGDHAVPTEPTFARQVEIFRGPATLLFGSGASGGVVNVVNDRILKYVPDTLEGDISLQYETVSDGVNGAGSFNFGKGNIAVHLDGMKRHTNDYKIPGYADLNRDPGEEMEKGIQENSFVEAENVAMGLSFVGERGFAGFAVSRYDSNYGIVVGHHHGEDDHFEEIDLDMEDDHHEDEDDHEEEGHHEDEDGHEEEGHHEDEDGHEDEGDHEDEEDHEEGGPHEDEDGHEEEGHHEDEDDHEEEDHHDDDEEHHGEEGDTYVDLGVTRYDFEASLYEPFAAIHRIRTRWTFTDYIHQEVEGNGDIAITFSNEEVGGRVEIVHHPLAGWQGAFGIQYHYKEFSALGEEEYLPPSELESIAAFLLGNYSPPPR